MRKLTHTKQLSTLGAAAVALAVAVGLSSPLAAFSTSETLPDVPETYIDDAGTIHYTFDPSSMPGATLSTEYTEQFPDGSCNLILEGQGRGTVNPTAGPTITVGSEVSFSPFTCERVMATASYALDEAPQVVLDTLNPHDRAETESEHYESTGDADANSLWYGELNTRIQDPVTITVSSTTSEHNWDSTGWMSHTHGWSWYS